MPDDRYRTWQRHHHNRQYSGVTLSFLVVEVLGFLKKPCLMSGLPQHSGSEELSGEFVENNNSRIRDGGAGLVFFWKEPGCMCFVKLPGWSPGFTGCGRHHWILQALRSILAGGRERPRGDRLCLLSFPVPPMPGARRCLGFLPCLTELRGAMVVSCGLCFTGGSFLGSLEEGKGLGPTASPPEADSGLQATICSTEPSR